MSEKSDIFRARYECQAIRDLKALELALGVPLGQLERLAANSDRLYQPVKVRKNGKVRETFSAHPELKEVQRRIKDHILCRVAYPSYLHGSLKGHSARSNAESHKGARLCITEDIKSFFPSISEAAVYAIWKRFFRFSDDVAKLLTKLTTRLGELPQGAKTSSYLANLALWEFEPEIVEKFQECGLRYSRYVDDIAVSAASFVPEDQKTFIVSQIYGMLKRCGLKPNREKQEITSSANRIAVTKLVVKREGVGLSRRARSAIEAAVFQLEQRAVFGECDSTLIRMLSSASARVGQLKKSHPTLAQGLKSRIDLVRSRLT